MPGFSGGICEDLTCPFSGTGSLSEHSIFMLSISPFSGAVGNWTGKWKLLSNIILITFRQVRELQLWYMELWHDVLPVKDVVQRDKVMRGKIRRDKISISKHLNSFFNIPVCAPHQLQPPPLIYTTMVECRQKIVIFQSIYTIQLRRVYSYSSSFDNG